MVTYSTPQPQIALNDIATTFVAVVAVGIMIHAAKTMHDIQNPKQKK